VGTKPQIVKLWNDVKDILIEFYDKVLNIELRVARVAPWWMAHAGLIAEKGTVETGTYDFDAYLPYRGDRKQEWLEIQNASSVGTKYTGAFNVKGRKEDIWSGCTGASIERVICAFLAQKGFDTKNWPKEVRTLFEKRIKKAKPLKFC
jgi:seryl-tRNA synthetase